METRSDVVGRKMQLALAALEQMVRGEYPEGYSLVQIAETWGSEYGVTAEQTEALESVEPLLKAWREAGIV